MCRQIYELGPQHRIRYFVFFFDLIPIVFEEVKNYIYNILENSHLTCQIYELGPQIVSDI